MRVVTELFVSALVRRAFASGGFAAIERRGATEAGAIFIRQRFRTGLETLFGPAPQSVFGNGEGGERFFEIRADRDDPIACDAILAREAKFDSDLWIVGLEVDDIADLFDVVPSHGSDGFQE